VANQCARSLPLDMLAWRCDVANSVIGIVQDITEICRMQQEQADKDAATAQLNATLAAEIKHKEEMYRLLRTLSHEIRNPLHGILGNTQALLDMLQACEQQAAAGVTRQKAAADVSDDVIHNSSDVAHPDGGGGGVSPAELSPTSSLESPRSAALPQLQCRRRANSGSSNSSSCSNSSISNSSSGSGSTQRQRQHVTRQQHELSPPRLSTSSLKRLVAAQKWADSLGSFSSPQQQQQQQQAANCSSKVANMRAMVAEIHECALHQVE
jgi:signal transduction histidine kinase